MRFIRSIRLISSINRLACKLSSHRFEHSDRRVRDRALAVDCCSRCGWQIVRRAYEAEGEAVLVPGPACETGQVLVRELLVLASMAIAFAIAVFVLTAPSTDAAELARMGWVEVTGR